MKASAILAFATVVALTSCVKPRPTTPESDAPSTYSVTERPLQAGGQPVLVLEQKPAANAEWPKITRVELLPGRGMNVFRMQGWIPGKGAVEILAGPPIEESLAKMTGKGEDQYGNVAFYSGGPILIPYANRIRGKYVASKNEIETTIDGHRVSLPANWHGKNPGAEKHSMHGLILNRAADEMKKEANRFEAVAEATIHAGDFGGHWISKTDLHIQVGLHAEQLILAITATNVGKVREPMAIGWHPFFQFAGPRQQARLMIPAESRAIIDNYDNVFPSGKLVPVAGTPYDFTDLKPLGDLYLDDSFTALKRANDKTATAAVADPQGGYGVFIRAVSPEIKVFQVYAPVDHNFVAVEPQYNLGDPFSAKWKKSGVTDTGMVLLEPGQSTTYLVRVELTRAYQ